MLSSKFNHWCIKWRQTWLEKRISFPAEIASKLENFTRKIKFRDEPINLLIPIQILLEYAEITLFWFLSLYIYEILTIWYFFNLNTVLI